MKTKWIGTSWYKSKWFKENNPHWYTRAWKISWYYMRLIWSYMCEPFIRLRNYIRVKKYPFLEPNAGWGISMEYHREGYKYCYEETWFDCVPSGWRKMCWDLCKELKQVIEEDHLTDYKIHQVKEKWGQLCWYDEGGNKRTFDIVEKYEDLSARVCQICGRPAEYETKGWIGYYCLKCAKKFNDFNPNNIIKR